MAEWIGYDPTTAFTATAFKAASPSILRTTPQNKTRQIIVARLELAIICVNGKCHIHLDYTIKLLYLSKIGGPGELRYLDLRVNSASLCL